jgi:hypothetical protein
MSSFLIWLISHLVKVAVQKLVNVDLKALIKKQRALKRQFTQHTQAQSLLKQPGKRLGQPIKI